MMKHQKNFISFVTVFFLYFSLALINIISAHPFASDRFQLRQSTTVGAYQDTKRRNRIPRDKAATGTGVSSN